jgi:ParB-like chromosome segregation protein Spo0J
MMDTHMDDEETSAVLEHEATARLLELEQLWEAPVGEMPDRVPLADLEVIEVLFQPRTMSEKHLDDLKRAIKSVGALEPLLVLPVGNRLIVVDGHHRREAYELVDFAEPVPVTYFHGSPRQAMFEAVRQNSMAKLPMHNREKQDYAWKLVLVGDSSKNEISVATGVSTSQVANMRKARSLLKDDAFEHKSWFRARRAAQGKGQLEVDVEEMKERQALDWANRMAKEFTTKMATHPEIAAMALNIYFGRKLPELYHELRSFMAEDMEFEEWDEGHSDF